MTEEIRRVVDQPTFDAIECSRCGQCCEAITFPPEFAERDDKDRFGWWLHRGPLGWLELYGYYGGANGRFGPQDDMLWFGQLTPSVDNEGHYRYSCGFFEREPDGLGVCTIYADRPRMCSDFPYGRPVNSYPDCTWNVELIDFDVVQEAGVR